MTRDGLVQPMNPEILLLAGIALAIQLVAYVPAYLQQTEKFFDLVGSATSVTVAGVAFLMQPTIDGLSVVLLTMVVVWAARLGWFLVRRIHSAGTDSRFDKIKASWSRFLLAWTLQGIWVFVTLSPALVAIIARDRDRLDVFALVGVVVWVAGFAIEVVADNQKRRFRDNPINKNNFIQTGLWSRSRHPNYFGEILLWVGITIVALPSLSGWGWLAALSPVFVTVLLTKVSGIPILERRADEKWGRQDDYESYKKRTPILFPRI